MTVTDPTRAVRSVSLALLGGLRLSGRLRLPTRLVRLSLIGGMDLDLSEAEFAEAGQLTVVKVSIMGGLEMRVPGNATIDVHSVAIGGHSVEAGGDVGAAAPGPRIRIFALAILGGVKVRRLSGPTSPAAPAGRTT